MQDSFTSAHAHRCDLAKINRLFSGVYGDALTRACRANGGDVEVQRRHAHGGLQHPTGWDLVDHPAHHDAEHGPRAQDPAPGEVPDVGQLWPARPERLFVDGRPDQLDDVRPAIDEKTFW